MWASSFTDCIKMTQLLGFSLTSPLTLIVWGTKSMHLADDEELLSLCFRLYALLHFTKL